MLVIAGIYKRLLLIRTQYRLVPPFFTTDAFLKTAEQFSPKLTAVINGTFGDVEYSVVNRTSTWLKTTKYIKMTPDNKI